MPHADINPVIDKILLDIQANEPTLKTVEIFAGQFTLSDAEKYGFKTPAFFLAPLGGPDDDHPHSVVIDIDWSFVGFIVAKGDRGTPQHSSDALTLAQSLSKFIKNNQWGFAPDVKRAKKLKAELISSHKGVTIWALRWQQNLKIACQ